MDNKSIVKNLKLHFVNKFDHYCSNFRFQPNFMGSCGSCGSDTGFWMCNISTHCHH